MQPAFLRSWACRAAGGLRRLTWVLLVALLPVRGLQGHLRGAETQKGTAARGAKLYLRLDTPVSTRSSHLHAPVEAKVVREVAGPQGVLIPLGTTVRGQIDKLIPSSTPTDRAQLRIRFDRLEIPGKPDVALDGHLVEVENAREKVLDDGTIQGVLASELPVSRLDDLLAKSGSDTGELTKIKEQTLGKADTSIEYPVGTDMTFVLEKPLDLAGAASPSAAGQPSRAIRGAVARLLADAPQRASGKKGEPGDPLNLVVIGNADSIRQAFKEAGWSEAERKTGKSILDTIRAVASEQGFGEAPVSDLYLYGRREDLAFEKMLNTFLKRHHLRLWRSPATTSDGREIWLGAGTHDAGLDVRPGVVSHAIDPDLDSERAKVGADLLVTGRVRAEGLVTRPNPLAGGLTATGASWKTDGRLVLVELKAP